MLKSVVHVVWFASNEGGDGQVLPNESGMQYLPTPLCLLLISATLSAADWFVAPGGNDGAAGSQATPLATLAGAVSKATGSSDRIVLRRGGTYRITADITIPSGRTLTNYDSGALPIVTASAAVAISGGGVVKTASVSSEVLACWADGAFVPLGREPNSGWLQTGTGTTQNQIFGAPSHSANLWNGAQVRWRRWSWWYEIRPITSDNGIGQLNLGSSATESGIEGSEGSSFFVDHFLAAVDQPGEWFSTNSTFHLYPPSSSSTYEIATGLAQVKSDGALIDGVAFRRFAGVALSLNNATSTVQNCVFSEIGDTAISLSWNAGGSHIADNVFTTIHNSAISWIGGGVSGGVIERNVFTMIGMQPGYGGQGTWHSSGIVLINGNGVIVRLNRFTDIGYCGVIVGNAGQTIERNFFRRCTRTLNDGAAIYTNCSDTIITNNIVLDSLGDTETGQPWFPLGQGIWPEFLGYQHTTVSGNTITGCNGNGVFLSNHPNSTISGNVCLDNRLNGLYLDQAGNHVITNNVLGNPSATRRTTAPENLMNPAWVQPSMAIYSERNIDYGTMSGTTVIGGGVIFRTTKSGQPSHDYSALAPWAAGESSWADPAATLLARDAILLINDSPTVTDLTPPAGIWTRLDGTAVNGPLAIAAFRSVVLISTTPTPAAKPYYLASAGGTGGGHETVVGSRDLGRFPNGASPSSGDLTPVATIFLAVPVSTGGSGSGDTGGTPPSGGGSPAPVAIDNGGGSSGGCGVGSALALLSLGLMSALRLRMRSPLAR